MAGYKCPLCKTEMERDVALFLDHTNQHIIEKIKEKHPDWAASDGTCQKCRDYYENLRQS